MSQYWQAICPVHQITTFGEYYETQEQLGRGCLACHFERQQHDPTHQAYLKQEEERKRLSKST